MFYVRTFRENCRNHANGDGNLQTFDHCVPQGYGLAALYEQLGDFGLRRQAGCRASSLPAASRWPTVYPFARWDDATVRAKRVNGPRALARSMETASAHSR